MPSRKMLLLAVAVGVAIIGGSAALDATTPDRTYTYEVRELSASPEGAAAVVVDDTTVDPAGPSAVFIASDGPGDRPERTALREAANGSRTKAAFPGSLVDHRYAVVGTGGTISDVSEVYRLHEYEEDGTVRVTAERVTLHAFYDELAVSAATPRLRELVRTGELTTHERLTAVLIEHDGRYYHVTQPPLSTRYAGVGTNLHDVGYLLGSGIALLAGGWYVLERWGRYVWGDGPEVRR
ncbi:hypothetical protein [Haloferax sp. Atlit-12N]|uniref:hypothetical protein n=1 Tax=Haloferax sp. Atlit-12N TaxID=2077203 RepID=UPI001F34C355|nr:hypothetical protein [Haloferax sp. Atlit-12N]